MLSNLPNPSKAKYSHCTGIITLSEAVNAFKVNKPKEGEQSMKYIHNVKIESMNF